MKLNYVKPDKKGMRMLIVFACVVAALLFLDLLSKWLVQSFAVPGQRIEVIPNFFYITLSYNTGIAFGLGAGTLGSRVVNILISIVMSLAIGGYYFYAFAKLKTFERIVGALLLAGAVGNFVDRAFYWESTTGFDGVIDFLSFYLGGGPSAKPSSVNPFATFNFADAYLTVGVILLLVILIIDMVKPEKKAAKKQPSDSAEEGKDGPVQGE